MSAPANIPLMWLPDVRMRRIIVHWTAGTHRASAFERSHYHVLYEADGTPVRGVPIVSNAKPLRADYAQHTAGCNTESIGVSLCCMGDTERVSRVRENPFFAGPYPMTREQWDAMVIGSAQLCRFYKIPVTLETVLSHAEVQSNLGIKQQQKWDFTRLAFDLSVKGARACGDKLRREVAALV